MKTIIGIGNRVDIKHGYVTGLAMMFDMTMSVAKDIGFRTVIVDLNNRFNKTGSDIAKPTVSNFLNYGFIFLEMICRMIVCRKAIVYINPSPTKFGLYRDCLVVLLAKFLGHKVVFHQFGALFETFYASLKLKDQRIVCRVYNSVDALIVEGEFAKSQYNSIVDENKIHVVRNGLPESNHIEINKGKVLKEGEPFNVLFMNNMIESKGYIDVLKAINILVNDRKINVDCTFAGTFLSVPDDKMFHSVDEAKIFFESYIIEKGLSQRVIYRNSIFGKEKADVFIKSNVFLLPSYYIFEGQPTAILEALSYGCVPIVTKYRLIPEMVNDKNGLFVSAESPIEIANAIEKLYNSPDYYRDLSEGCIESYKNNFTRDQYSKNINMIFRALL